MQPAADLGEVRPVRWSLAPDSARHGCRTPQRVRPPVQQQRSGM